MAQTTLFNIPKRDLSKQAQQKQKKQVVYVNSANKIEMIIKSAESLLSKNVNKNLGLITTEEDLVSYVDKCIENGLYAIDLETTGLDPILETIVGVCLKTYGQDAVYIPLGHIHYITGVKLKGQLPKEIMIRELQRLQTAKAITHNGKFDGRFMRFYGNYKEVDIMPYWDTQAAACLLNENEAHGLKYLHSKYIEGSPTGTQLNTFSKLFEGVPFNQIPIEIGYLYAAYDAEMTFELYLFQERYLGNPTYKECIEQNLQETCALFRDIEMPLISIVADMEDEGIQLDYDYVEILRAKYQEDLDNIKEEYVNILNEYSKQINDFKFNNPMMATKLEDPINLSSPTQLAILLYDILKLPVVDKDKPRGTGEEILEEMEHPVTEIILKHRGVNKLMNTYIEKMPGIVNSKTKKIHCSFNQFGAGTGRFSSSDPNMQNIPAKNKDIRKMFKAKEGWALVGGDFSQQEPRCLAHFSGDYNLLEAYRTGRDVYSTIASIVFDTTYEDCKEFYSDGTENHDGKERRSAAKGLVLGMMYGMGEGSIAEGMNVTKEKAQLIMESFFDGFPTVKACIDMLKKFAKDEGYVQTAYGRKRRLPDILLEPFTFSTVDGSTTVSRMAQFELMSNLQKATTRNHVNKIKKEARDKGIIVRDNSNLVARAERQSFNALIQGTAADITKKAMLLVGTNQRLKELDFRLVLTVHDELIGTCPIENAKECSELMSKLMIEAPSDKISVPMKVDCEVTERWYGDRLEL